MARLLRIVVLATLGAGLLALGGWVYVRQALQHEPEFYVRALERPTDVQAAAGDELEKEVLDLHNKVRHEGLWSAVFTEAQINGWLAVDLPSKLPDLLPAGAKEPRVAIQPSGAELACRYEGPQLKSVISLSLEVRLADEPNVLAVRVRRARAGAIPVPLSKFLDRISRAAHRSGIQLRWAQEEGDPVALVRLDPRHPEFPHQKIELDSVELVEGEVRLGGRTEAAPPREMAARQAGRTEQFQ